MSLVNDYKACRVYDLNPENRRIGPFVVIQSAILPDDPLQQEQIYLLRRDGVWVSLFNPAVQEATDHCTFCFGTLAEIVQLLQSLPSAAQMDQTPAPPEKMAQWQQAVDAAGGPFAFLEERVRQWRSAGQG